VNVLQDVLHVLIPVHELQELEATSLRLETVNCESGASTDPAIIIITNAFGQLEVDEVYETYVRDTFLSSRVTRV
jgi:hypothetical protein